MADYFDPWHEDSFDTANAPRFVDFKNLNNDDLANRSAWFDSHESFYADATFLQSPAPKKRKKVAAKAVTAKEEKSTTRRKIKSASLARPLQPVRSDEKERKQRKRAASVRPQLEGNRREAKEEVKEVKEAMKGKEILTANKENVLTANAPICAPIPDLHPILKNLPISPVPEAKKIESVEQLNKRLLDQIEERRLRRQASMLQPLAITAPPPPAPESEPARSTTSVAPPPEQSKPSTEQDEEEPATAVPAAEPKTKARAGQSRAVGKQVPVGKVLQQQRTKRLEGEMAKQRERAKAQREQKHKRSERIEEARRQREQEKEQKAKKEKSQQTEQLKRQREQEKEQRRKEKERREVEERERKLARIEEKQNRKRLPLNQKQMFAEEFAIRSVKPLTFPKEFKFATEARSRSNKDKHVEQAVATKPAVPVRKGIASIRSASSRTHGLGRTKPVSFKFSTEARAARKRAHAVPGEDNNAGDKVTRKRRRVEAETDVQQ